jgi:hypothetical protein
MWSSEEEAWTLGWWAAVWSSDAARRRGEVYHRCAGLEARFSVVLQAGSCRIIFRGG